jgi:hypothetical protein
MQLSKHYGFPLYILYTPLNIHAPVRIRVVRGEDRLYDICILSAQ